MYAQQNCIGPVFCRARDGGCCLVVMDRGSFVCPLSCGAPATARKQIVQKQYEFYNQSLFGFN